jgi:hypothetical protein
VLWTETDDEDHWRGWVLNANDQGWVVTTTPPLIFTGEAALTAPAATIAAAATFTP